MVDKYFYANGLLLAEACEPGYTYYYHEDALGSVRLITQSSNTFLFSSNYQPFGPSYQRTGASFFRYTGKPQDTATGLYYFGARFYNPATQRFVTKDTLSGIIQDPQSLNKDVYARDNPLKFVDPSGHSIGLPFDGSRVIRVDYKPTIEFLSLCPTYIIWSSNCHNLGMEHVFMPVG